MSKAWKEAVHKQAIKSAVKKQFKGTPWPVLHDKTKINMQVEKDLQGIRRLKPISDTSFRHTNCTQSELKKLNQLILEGSNT